MESRSPNELLELLLNNRGITTAEERERFLAPSYEMHLHDPFLLSGMEKSVSRLYEAITKKEKIVIYADYDCDGIPGAAVLSDFFNKVGYSNVSVYIPDRHEEGYGLHLPAVEALGKEGVSLVITIDLGITAVDQVSRANELGIDVIITDHHLPQEVLPPAYAIINPKIDIGTYPCDMLCGSGVVFKLVQGFIARHAEEFSIHPGWEKWLLDMVGLATLSDMVPLRDENRTLSFFGMRVMEKTRRPGLQQLFRKMNIDPRYMSEEDITFMVAPRLNAASRMDSPYRAFELLSETDEVKAGALATHLTKINDERKTIVATIMKETKKILETREIREVIVIGNPKWRVGVLGLVASKLTETYKKPVFVWGQEGGENIKGSCRSDGSVNLVSLMQKVPTGVFTTFGGHELAGGFAVTHEEVHFLEDKLISAYGESRFSAEDSKEQGAVLVDCELSLEDVTMKTYSAIKPLAPFGLANPKPTFSFPNVEIADLKLFGKEKNHLELTFHNEEGRPIKAIAFFATHESFTTPLEKGKKINLVASFELSYFMRRPELRLRVVDIR